jgi:hypothetical protein
MDLLDRVKRAGNLLAKLGKAREGWDFEAFASLSRAFRDEISHLPGSWEEFLTETEGLLKRREGQVVSDDYRGELSKALQAAGIPYEGEFPEYEIAPFRLVVAVEERIVRLILGRRVQTSTAFAPDVVARWVQEQYERLVKRPFNSQRFYRGLVQAYEVAAGLAYGRERGRKPWGRPVPLERLYELFTLRAESRKEYPREHFVYDLARLRQAGLKYGADTLEFGFSRDQRRAYIVRDLSSGRVDRFSSLTIHRQEG